MSLDEVTKTVALAPFPATAVETRLRDELLQREWPGRLGQREELLAGPVGAAHQALDIILQFLHLTPLPLGRVKALALIGRCLCRER